MTTFSNTQALIAFSEIETGLLNLAQAQKTGKRVITADRYIFDDQLGELADKFWRIFFADRFDSESTVIVQQVAREVSALGYSLDSSCCEWEFAREQQEHEWHRRNGSSYYDMFDDHPADWCLEMC